MNTEELRAEVERLNSELAAEKGRVGRAQRAHGISAAKRSALQSELTKVRELMQFAVRELRNPLHIGWEDDLADRLEAELSHHSAPAVEPSREMFYQYREKLVGIEKWSLWMPCDQALHDKYRTAPIENGFAYEVRAFLEVKS